MPKKQTETEYLNNDEVCQRLNISPFQLTVLRQTGELSAKRGSRTFWYPRDEIEARLKRERQPRRKS